MKNFYLRLAGVFFLGLLGLLASAAFGPKENSGSGTKNKTNFQQRQLLKIEDVGDPGKTSEKAAYLFTIQDGASPYVAHYTLNYFQHDRSKAMTKGEAVEYRIDGKHLMLKTPNDEESKMRLCDQKGNCVKCGSAVFCGVG
jgi:hypothetical protein